MKWKSMVTLSYVVVGVLAVLLIATYLPDGGIPGRQDAVRGTNSSSLPSVPASTPSIDKTSGAILDSDYDGLSDAEEKYLVYAFKPYLVFAADEPLNVLDESATFYQVHVLADKPDLSVALTFVVAYSFDNGLDDARVQWLPGECAESEREPASVLPSLPLAGHCGDTEAFRMYVRKVYDTWVLDRIALESYGGSWVEFEADAFTYRSTHPTLYVSESKHKFYPSVQVCQAYHPRHEASGIDCDVEFERCGGGVMMNLYAPADHNVGEAAYPLLDNLDHVTFLFPGEGAWQENPFCGGASYATCLQYVQDNAWDADPCADTLSRVWFRQ